MGSFPRAVVRSGSAPLALAATFSVFGIHCGASQPEPSFSDGADSRRSQPEDGGGPSSASTGPTDAGTEERDASLSPPAPSVPPMTMPAFIVGYNEGWFGPNYGSDLTTNWDPVLVDKTLDGIVKAGGRVVRLWLFEGRQGLVMGASAPQIQGVSPVLLTHLGETLDAARARGLWVYLTALDGNEMPPDAGPTRDFFWNLLNDSYGEGAAYQNKVLAPLLALLANHRDVIYGFDLLNEIQAPRLRSYWPEPVLAPRAFIQRTTSFIKSKAPWLRITSTAGWDVGAVDLATGFFSGLGLDFYDLHVYADSGAIAGAANVCSRAATDGVPVILGEFGQKTHLADDALQTSATQNFLTNAKSSCFKGALGWRFDPGEAWWAFVRQDGSFRPAVNVMTQVSSAP